MLARLLTPVLLVGLLAVPCLTQTDNTSSAPNTNPPANEQADASAEKKKPKKVWTNDEIGSLHGPVSVVGDTKQSSGDRGNKTPTDRRQNPTLQRQIENYHNQIGRLQSQIEAIDKRVVQLKGFKGENTAPSAGIDPSRNYNMIPVEEQVKQLEEKKKQLQVKIADIENEARKEGIDPGELR
jgi:chromosome segregation ATPase